MKKLLFCLIVSQLTAVGIASADCATPAAYRCVISEDGFLRYDLRNPTAGQTFDADLKLPSDQNSASLVLATAKDPTNMLQSIQLQLAVFRNNCEVTPVIQVVTTGDGYYSNHVIVSTQFDDGTDPNFVVNTSISNDSGDIYDTYTKKGILFWKKTTENQNHILFDTSQSNLFNFFGTSMGCVMLSNSP